MGIRRLQPITGLHAIDRPIFYPLITDLHGMDPCAILQPQAEEKEEEEN